MAPAFSSFYVLVQKSRAIRESPRRESSPPFAPLRISHDGAYQKRPRLQIEVQLHVQPRFVRALQSRIFQLQLHDALQAGQHFPFWSKIPW